MLMASKAVMFELPGMFVGIELFSEELNWSFDLLGVDIGKENFNVIFAFWAYFGILCVIVAFDRVAVDHIRKYKELMEGSMHLWKA
jgi:hypothetical protein